MRCSQFASDSPLHRPAYAPWVPPLGMALDLAREALAERASANIHDKQAMIAAAVDLEIRLRGLIAALDKSNGLTTAVAEHGPFPMPTGNTGPALMTSEQRKAIAVQIGDAKPATHALIGSFAESVANVRNHDHPSWEDLYCMNLTSYMGERMAPVLRRLLDAETELTRLRVRVAELEALTPAPVQTCRACGGSGRSGACRRGRPTPSRPCSRGSGASAARMTV